MFRQFCPEAELPQFLQHGEETTWSWHEHVGVSSSSIPNGVRFIAGNPSIWPAATEWQWPSDRFLSRVLRAIMQRRFKIQSEIGDRSTTGL